MSAPLDHAIFQNPPNTYREAPLWSWNDRLDPVELERQIELIAQSGWGGFFMHPRLGLNTPYLGKHWMEDVRLCVDSARRHGLHAWLYDEDKWPSGFAGGLAVAQNPSYRTTVLLCKVDDRPAFVAERIATFAAREVDGQLTDIRPEYEPRFEQDGDRVIQFYPQTMPLGNHWFNGYTYLSLLNPDAVRRFIEVTHEAYKQAVGDEFGRTVPGVFTDEPSTLFFALHERARQVVIPWTHDFPAYFKERNGYDLLPRLPEIFFNTGDYHATRYDYWRTVAERFVDAFTRQIYDWCNANNMLFTGHFMAEDTLLSQIQWCSAIMPHYAYMHYPGIDKLGRQINSGPGTLLTAKQLDSVVCQTGKPRAFCEDYGCSGQDFSFAGRKWLGDWCYVLGINFNDPHLSLYSMRGERKRDYPQNLFYQQPWWPENRIVADYFARLSYALSQGTRVVDILVIHPLSSAWTLYRPDAALDVMELDQTLDRLLMTLVEHQRDFHLGDEMLMARGGPVEARVGETDEGPFLAVGEMHYRVVIVPPGTTLAADTVRTLNTFAEAGGTILALAPHPTLVDGRQTQESPLPASTRTVKVDTLPGLLDKLLPFDVRVAGNPSIWVHHRKVETGDCYFLANIDVDKSISAAVQVRGGGEFELWDPSTGAVTPLASNHADGLSTLQLEFAAAGSYLLVRRPDGTPTVQPPSPRRSETAYPLSESWDVELLSPNALTLDTAAVRLGEGPWSQPMHILEAHATVEKAGVGTPFALRFTVEVDKPPAGPLHLVVESPERFRISVNGERVESIDAGFWVDISFRQVPLPFWLRAGTNEIVLAGVFGRDSELESIYLTGAFAVGATRLGEESRHNGQCFDRYAPRFVVTARESRFALPHTGTGRAVDLTQQGLPFFAGRLALRQSVEIPATMSSATLVFDDLRAALVHVRVNGVQVQTLAWPPYKVDITPYLHEGTNDLELELVGTLRNLLGPHHVRGGDLSWTGPETFRDQRRWVDEYILAPFGFAGVTIR
ncbi:MAG: hypothetical protein H3C34_18240 [Caldilineaceae bacterium]|nr:hypothetical protein [Caldilineaceae bacterium]